MTSVENETLIDWIKAGWRERRFLGICAGCGLLIGAVIVLILRPQYEARMIVAPAIHDYQEKVFASQKFATPMAERSAETLSREFTKFEQVFREVSTARALTKHLKLLESVNHDGVFRFTHENIGDAGSLSNYLKREIKITPLGATSSRLLSYRHPDPLFAALLLKSIQEETDRLIREEAKTRSKARVAYLQKELQSAYNPEHRQALADLLMAEEREHMLSNMDAPYAADMIEPPSVSLKPVWPKASVILPVSFILGLIAGFVMMGAGLNRKVRAI